MIPFFKSYIMTKKIVVKITREQPPRPVLLRVQLYGGNRLTLMVGLMERKIKLCPHCLSLVKLNRRSFYYNDNFPIGLVLLLSIEGK